MIGEVIIVLVVLLALGVGALAIEVYLVLTRRCERPESISDAQTTSEKDLW